MSAVCARALVRKQRPSLVALRVVMAAGLGIVRSAIPRRADRRRCPTATRPVPRRIMFRSAGGAGLRRQAPDCVQIGGSRCARDAAVLAGCDRHARRDRPGARPRPGPRAARLTRPSAAAVSGPVLSALHPREEDPPACRPGRRARDAGGAGARGTAGNGAGPAPGKVHHHVAIGCLAAHRTRTRHHAG
jgi:hypothetical protein